MTNRTCGSALVLYAFLVSGFQVALQAEETDTAGRVCVAVAPIVVETGPAKLVETRFRPMRLYTTGEYEETLRYGTPMVGDVITIHAWPSRLSPNAGYGLILIGGKILTYVIDEGPSGYSFVLDRNGDGDLTNDRRETMSPTSIEAASKEGDLFQIRVDEVFHAIEANLHVIFKLVLVVDKRKVWLFVDTVREGEATFGSRRITVAARGTMGLYGRPYSFFYFDVDGDGHLEMDQRYSDEAYRIEDRVVNLGGVSYEFAVDRHGDRLTLRPLDECRPDRLRLSPGNPAPDFVFADIDGNLGELSDYRGRFVLLYFWGSWCGPCRIDTPKLVEAHASFGPSGFEILGINSRDPVSVIRSYVEDYGISWRQVAEGFDGPILDLYRVDRHPSYVLIGPGGMIHSRTIHDLESQVSKMSGATCPSE